MNRAQAKTSAIFHARTALHRAGFDLVRDPFRYRFLHALEQRAIGEVLDLGANVGQFGDELRDGGYSGRIVSVEPLRAAFEALTERARPDVRWEVERAAVSDAPGTLTMNVSANSVSSSALPILAQSTSAAPESGYVGTEEVETTTVDDLVERHALTPERALLKIDVQGFERPVLDGAKATLDRFAAVRTELTLAPLYEGQTLMPEMVALLAERGFDLWVIEPGFTDPVTRRLLQFDGTFVRR